jgi:hypothetical protein
MNAPLVGYKFRVLWAATGLVDTVNGRDYEKAERAIKRRYRTAIAHCFIGHAEPVAKEPRNFPECRKVF